MDREPVRREVVGRNALKNHGQDILMLVFSHYVLEGNALELIAKLDKIFEKEDNSLSPKDLEWIEKEVAWREAEDNPFNLEVSENKGSPVKSD